MLIKQQFASALQSFNKCTITFLITILRCYDAGCIFDIMCSYISTISLSFTG